MKFPLLSMWTGERNVSGGEGDGVGGGGDTELGEVCNNMNSFPPKAG